MNASWCYLFHDNNFWSSCGLSHVVMNWAIFFPCVLSIPLIKLYIPWGQLFALREEKFRTDISGWIQTSVSYSSDWGSHHVSIKWQDGFLGFCIALAELYPNDDEIKIQSQLVMSWSRIHNSNGPLIDSEIINPIIMLRDTSGFTNYNSS